MSLAKVHLWSDIPGKWGASTGPGARKHADKGDIVRQVTSLGYLAFVLKELKENIRVDRLDFHTHGSSGAIYLGKERLHYKTLKRFRDKGFDKVFAANARIFFHGCNVADGRYGELFLAEFANIFLKSRGGRVGGSTSLGFGTPWGGKIYHLWGDTVYAYNEGGRVRLKNHVNLDRGTIKKAIDRLKKEKLPYFTDIYEGRSDSKAREAMRAVGSAWHWLSAADNQLAGVGTGNGRFAKLNNAHYYTEKAYKAITILEAMEINKNLGSLRSL